MSALELEDSIVRCIRGLFEITDSTHLGPLLDTLLLQHPRPAGLAETVIDYVLPRFDAYTAIFILARFSGNNPTILKRANDQMADTMAGVKRIIEATGIAWTEEEIKPFANWWDGARTMKQVEGTVNGMLSSLREMRKGQLAAEFQAEYQREFPDGAVEFSR